LSKQKVSFRSLIYSAVFAGALTAMPPVFWTTAAEQIRLQNQV
jgi:hypothetical protein